MAQLNLQEMDVLQTIVLTNAENQKKIAEQSGCSVGVVNRSLKTLKEEGYIDGDYRPTEKTMALAEASRPKRAVILAAGYGIRIVPQNTECPKGLLEVCGEVMIERTIRMLREAGVKEITVVVGFMMERYEYLTGEFGVNLVFCEDYAVKNNLYSLAAVKGTLEDTYIVPCDIYCYRNPFRSVEFYSWYMAGKDTVSGSGIRVSRNREVLLVDEEEEGNRLIGITYLSGQDGAEVKKNLTELTRHGRNTRQFWEAAISRGRQMMIPARLIDSRETVEINSYEQLREIEYYLPILKNDLSGIIQEAFHISREEIGDITVMKKGLTNRSILFTVKGKRYILRIPGEGTSQFIDRKAEKEVYRQLEGTDITEEIIYFDAERGYKISRYIEDSRTVDETDQEELTQCMRLARSFHEMKLPGGHPLDLFRMIDYYEEQWKGMKSGYKDYELTRDHCLAMKSYVEAHANPPSRTHGDMNPDNFLVSGGAKPVFHLIDWEYSASADPLTDIAAFITYRMHDREYADRVIDAYFPEGCPRETRLLIYCYIALWGLYSSNWCEYRHRIGAESGEYAVTVYRYAKQFYRIFEEECAADERK